MLRDHPDQDQKSVIGFPPLGPVVTGIPETKQRSAMFLITVS